MRSVTRFAERSRAHYARAHCAHFDDGGNVESTWENRDLPVLDAIVRLLDQGSFSVSVRDVASETGFAPETVDRAIAALEGPFVVEYEQFATGGDPNP